MALMSCETPLQRENMHKQLDIGQQSDVMEFQCITRPKQVIKTNHIKQIKVLKEKIIATSNKSESWNFKIDVQKHRHLSSHSLLVIYQCNTNTNTTHD